MQTWVTLYTDASVTADGATWAIWLRSSLGRCVRSGYVAFDCRDTCAAELYAVHVGLGFLLSLRWLPCSGVTIKTDNLWTVRHIEGRQYDGQNAAIREAVRLYGATVRAVRAANAPIRLRLVATHVKGHQRGNDTRAYINRQVDALARQRQRQRRDRT